MKSRLRNGIVGVTVLGALLILAVGIYRFGSAPAAFFKPPQFHVVFDSARGDGLGDGSPISYLGVEAGRVSSVRRDSATNAIVIEADLSKDPPIPANVSANIIFTSPLGGVSSLELITDGPPSSETLKDGARLRATYLGSTFIPKEFAETAREATKAIKQYNDSKLLDTLKATVEETNAQIKQAGEVVKNINLIVGDPKLRDNVQKSLDAIAKASEDASAITTQLKATATRFDQIAQKTDKAVDTAQGTLEVTTKRVDEIGLAVADQLRKLSATLDNVTAITAKINEGRGTAGQLLNDPKLYESLLATTRELQLTLSDIKRYVNQVENEGFYLRLNK